MNYFDIYAKIFTNIFHILNYNKVLWSYDLFIYIKFIVWQKTGNSGSVSMLIAIYEYIASKSRLLNLLDLF
jgi:hypothetical protein